MKTLFDRALSESLQARAARLRGNPAARWGTMTAAQAAAHCADALEVASGDRVEPRMFIGRLIGWLVKRTAVGNDTPLKKNTPTTPDLVIGDTRDLDREVTRLCAQIVRFASGGAAGVTTAPHAFFGTLTPDEWANLQYKHLDHHLRQFGA